MTRTGRWFEQRRRELLLREGAGVLLGTVGTVLVALTMGVIAAKTGLFGAVPPLVFLAWVFVFSIVAVGVYVYRLRSHFFRASAIAQSVESAGGLRRGSLLGMVFGATNGSPALIEAADTQSVRWLDTHGNDALSGMRRRGVRSIWSGALVGVLGVSAFAASHPGHPAAGRFWSPLASLTSGAVSVSIEVDRVKIRRGESVDVTVTVAGGDVAQLYSREPGEAWSSRTVDLDSAGRAVVRLGPLNADKFLRAESSGRQSQVVHIQVAIPAFLADLTLYARFPEYLERIDEAVQPGDSVVFPEGTALVTTGSATVGLKDVRWRSPDGRGIPLAIEEQSSFQGVTTIRDNGIWTLEVVPVDGRILDQPDPTINVTVVADSIPFISVPLPGVDTVAPANLRQPIVVDVRDDHGLSLVEAVTRRAGDPLSDARVDTLLLPDAATDRAVLTWLFDLNDRGLQPGDTAFYRIRALDNAPSPHLAQTREFALRLPSESELRQAIRDATNQLAADADSLRARQETLTDETESLAASQARLDEEAKQGDEGLEFSEAQRASEVAEQQTALIDQAEQLADNLQEIAESAWEAGMTDPEFHKQLAELQEMLKQSITPEMEGALEALQQALENLDPEAMREALERMVEQQQQMQEQLERSKKLFERAAMEGAMSTLAKDAEEIAKRQDELNEAMESGESSDSAAAKTQESIGADTERLQEQLDQLRQKMEAASEQTEGIQQSEQQAGEAAQNMQQGAQQSRQGESQQAQQSGEQAAQQLQSIPQDLREQLQEMRGEWKEEVLQQMDMALAETADLARRQTDLSSRMQRGEASADLRGEQAAVRQGVDQIIERLQDAAGKNALISPNLSTSLGFSRLKMTESLEQFEQPTPNTRQAGQLASEALDGLNAVAAALLRSRSDVEGSQSGSGMAEAMEQMAQMASQQEALNAETGGVMPLMPQGGEQLLQQLQQLAEQQQSLGNELEGMAAQEGLPDGTEELAEEAMEIAEMLAAGRLDAETLDRQEELFRKLLDAGRSLRSDEEDDKKERQSVTAEQNLVGAPAQFDPAATGPGLRYPYPSWEQLRRYSAEDRRIILNYFRRLNAGRP